ncbi:sensor histidine kinase [Microbacterium pullorum]|uniref:sensor histidine kinase n=1 Tax=Microbacterium pullorum TaxID=2762236 RepID=UPI00296B2E35|nr:HAMP domain-containing sensor histidine kinase [Microbacterium pullorum]
MIIAAGVGILVAVILLTSRAEGAENGDSAGTETSMDDLVVDTDKVLPAVIVLGVIGVALLALVAWLAARRSVRPLQTALRQQRNFVADASHELRTPLTTLSSRIQVLQRRHQGGQPIAESIAELRRDAAMMSDVLNDLLLAAEDDAAIPADPTSVIAAARSALSAVQAIADETQVELRLDAPDDLAVSLPTVALTRAILALVDNAVQHSPAGAAVTVSVARDGAVAAIRVIDQGRGITGIGVDRVFDRFAHSAEGGGRRGFGLGLSLVRDVAVRSGGSVAVERSSPTGTTFLLRLPLAR